MQLNVQSTVLDSMDGGEMHRLALRLMGTAIGWVWNNEEILKALRR